MMQLNKESLMSLIAPLFSDHSPSFDFVLYVKVEYQQAYGNSQQLSEGKSYVKD